MGGHSHWAGIKHKKALTDAKKGKVWTKIVREITIAARIGGGDVSGNPRLRKALDDAKMANMPADNVKRAIMKGTGELEGAAIEELTYEGYGPNGVAFLIEVTTDNRNRTAGDIFVIFSKNGGNKGAEGCVSWMFKPKGVIMVLKTAAPDEDKLMEAALEAGAEDIITEDPEVYEIRANPRDLEKVKEGLVSRKIPVESAEATMIPDNRVAVSAEDAPKVLKLIDLLEEHEDVKNVYINGDIPDQVLAQWS
jgi:YebC/PmpR family DNA-binding regulatory protein